MEIRASMEKQAREDAVQRQAAEKQTLTRMHNKNVLERQIFDKDRLREVEKEVVKRDFEDNKAKGAQISQLDMFNRLDKKEKQAQYKEILDNQMQLSNQLRMYGNMTNVEKKMNKEDLRAWQNFDDNQYSLIPGLNSRKLPTIDHRDPSHKKERSLAEDHQRLQQFGFTRE